MGWVLLSGGLAACSATQARPSTAAEPGRETSTEGSWEAELRDDFDRFDPGADLVFRLDGEEVDRAAGLGERFPEPLFAILNSATIEPDPMTGPWTLEVDRVQHEGWVPA